MATWLHGYTSTLPADWWDHWDPEPLVLQRAEDIISIVNLVMDELLLEKNDIFEGCGRFGSRLGANNPEIEDFPLPYLVIRRYIPSSKDDF